MNRKTRMIIFAVIGVVMAVGLFVFAPAPEKNESAVTPVSEGARAPQEFVGSSPQPALIEKPADAMDPAPSSIETDSYTPPAELTADTFPTEEDPGGYLARVQLNAPEQVEAALRRAQLLYETGEIRPGDKPLTFVLHGPEVSIFFKENYAANQRLVDLAAKLSAFKVVDMKVCATRLGALGETKQSLAPFVSTIPFGPAEVSRLLDEENFIYF